MFVYQKVLDFRSFLTVETLSSAVMFLNFKKLKLLAVVNYLVVSQFISFPETRLLLNINGSAINLSGKPAVWCSGTQSPVVKRTSAHQTIRSWVSGTEEWGASPEQRCRDSSEYQLWAQDGGRTIRICAFAGHASRKDWCIYRVRMFILPGLRLGFETWDLSSLSLTCLLSFSRSKLLTSIARRPSFPW